MENESEQSEYNQKQYDGLGAEKDLQIYLGHHKRWSYIQWLQYSR